MESMSANDLPVSLEPHWRAIQKHFSGLLYIPVEMPRKAKMRERNAKIFAERLSGVRAEKIAERYGLSINRVYKIIAQQSRRAQDVKRAEVLAAEMTGGA